MHVFRWVGWLAGNRVGIVWIWLLLLQLFNFGVNNLLLLCFALLFVALHELIGVYEAGGSGHLMPVGAAQLVGSCSFNDDIHDFFYFLSFSLLFLPPLLSLQVNHRRSY